MDPQEYLITFYGIVVGLTATKYLQGWGDLIKDRAINRHYMVTLIWSITFFCGLTNEWLVEYTRWSDDFSMLRLMEALVQPFCLYIVGVLLFPNEHGSNEVEDYYQHFLKQKTIIMTITIGLLMLKFEPLNWERGWTKTKVQVAVLLFPVLASLLFAQKWVLLLSGTVMTLFWVAYILQMM